MMASDDPFQAAYRRRGTGWRGFAVLAMIAFLAGIAVMALASRYYPDWLPWTATPATVAPVKATAGSAAALRERPLTGADFDALAAREAMLAGQLSDLEARTATVDREAAAAAGNATRAEGLLVAFAARRALDRGLGLGYIEGQLRQRFGAAQPRAVATVILASRAPVTLGDLRMGLSTIGPDLVSGGRNDLMAGLRNSFANLIVLHKQGAPSPRPTDRLRRARQLLEGGQVEAALAEVARLPGASKAQRWTQAAHRYVDARHALDVIETAAIIGQAAQPAATTPNPPASANVATGGATAPAPAQSKN